MLTIVGGILLAIVTLAGAAVAFYLLWLGLASVGVWLDRRSGEPWTRF